MNQIPESARRRMQEQTAGDHPDADLLTAFAEHTLGGSERERVLSHLAACVTCREIVSLAMPDPVQAEVVAPASSWFRWPMLRWTAVAATVIVVGAAVSVLVPRRESTEQPSNYPASTNQDQKTQAPASQPADQKREAQAKKAGATGETRQRAGSEGSVVASRDMPVSESVAVTQPVTPAEAEKGQLAKLQRSEEDKARKDAKTLDDAGSKVAMAPGIAVGQVQGYAVPPQKPMSTADVAGAATKSDSQRVESTFQIEGAKAIASKKSANENVANNALTIDGANANRNVAGGPANTVANSARIAPPPPPPAPVAQDAAANVLAKESAASGGPRMARTPMGLAVQKSEFTAAFRWRVSSTGAVERSPDGKTWEKVEIDPGVTFRAMSSNGADLWAGGTGGALFHSVDAGRTWSRIKVTDEVMAVSETITSVDFIAPQMGTITTASHAVWFTRDSGRTWERKR